MTRLVEDWIKDIDVTIKEYESDLRSKTGFDFVTLASAASGVDRESIELAAQNDRVGVIPITAGQGIIGCFAESVAAILKCMNFDAFVTDDSDVAGIYEAHQKCAKIIFLADSPRSASKLIWKYRSFCLPVKNNIKAAPNNAKGIPIMTTSGKRHISYKADNTK